MVGRRAVGKGKGAGEGVTPLYQAPSARNAWSGCCLPSSLHLLQPPAPLCCIPPPPSRLYLSLLCFTLHSVDPPTPHSAIITPAPQPPLFHLHSQLITLPSSYFSYSHFFPSTKRLSGLHYLLRTERLGYRRSSVGQTKWFTEVRFLSYVSAHAPLLFKCGHWKCLALS